jgi:hypothetical protein
MLQFYHRLARWMYSFRFVLWALAAIAMATFAATLFPTESPHDELYTLGSATFLLWTVGVIIVTYGFVMPLPCVESTVGLWARLGVRVRRGYFWLLAVSMTALSCVLFFFSVRAAGILIRSVTA